MIKGVCDTCRERRASEKSGRTRMSSSALPGKFNDAIDCDVMFYNQENDVFHIIDRCIRHGAGIEIPGKTMTSILDACHHCGMQLGPAKVFYSDGEGALNDDTANRH
eukprot:334173-Pyramimonas_sp.AAC.1